MDVETMLVPLLTRVGLVGERLVVDGELEPLLLFSSNVSEGVTWWNADFATQTVSLSLSFVPVHLRSESILFLLVSCCCCCCSWVVTGVALTEVGGALFKPWRELMSEVNGWAMWAGPSSRGLMFKLKLKFGLRPLTVPETGRAGSRLGGGVGSETVGE